MTQIGVGIGVNKSPIKLPLDKQNLARKLAHDSDNCQKRVLNKQFSNNSSDRRATNDGGDDENSNSYESHSDADLNNKNEKKFSTLSSANRRGMSVNWGSNSTTAINLTSTKSTNFNQKNMKTFAQSFYRSSIRIGGLAAPSKLKHAISATQPSSTLTPIPSEPELSTTRIHSRPQPRPESLAIMSDAVFLEKFKARLTPVKAVLEPLPLIVDKCEQRLSDCTNFDQSSIEGDIQPEPSLIDEIGNQSTQQQDESSDESWRLLNSNNSLDIPYIDETDFEDLGSLEE